jgi:hypothetical protein
VSRVLRCRESDPGYDHTMSTDELSFDQRGLPVMSLVRVHNFSVSLDGFSAGADQSQKAPFGHAGDRLVRWFTGTRSFHVTTGQEGGSTGIRNAPQVIYWGDIDAPGLQFVSDLRGLGIAAHTVLMNLATLERYRHLAVTGAGPARHELPNLKSPEQQLYAHLVQYAADHGAGLLLEQERIPWIHAYQELTDAIKPPAPPS